MSTLKDLLETGGLTAIGAALRAGEVSARELATHCLEAVAASDINAFIDVQPSIACGGQISTNIFVPLRMDFNSFSIPTI